jgi:hypothetical protein
LKRELTSIWIGLVRVGPASTAPPELEPLPELDPPELELEPLPEFEAPPELELEPLKALPELELPLELELLPSFGAPPELEPLPELEVLTSLASLAAPASSETASAPPARPPVPTTREHAEATRPRDVRTISVECTRPDPTKVRNGVLLIEA